MHSPQHLYSNFTLIPVRKVVRCESDYHVAGLGLIVKTLRGITLEIFAGNSIFGFKHTLHLADDDCTGWRSSNYFMGSSEQILVRPVLGLF